MYKSILPPLIVNDPKKSAVPARVHKIVQSNDLFTKKRSTCEGLTNKALLKTHIRNNWGQSKIQIIGVRVKLKDKLKKKFNLSFYSNY